jgi:hypothetical protein
VSVKIGFPYAGSRAIPVATMACTWADYTGAGMTVSFAA